MLDVVASVLADPRVSDPIFKPGDPAPPSASIWPPARTATAPLAVPLPPKLAPDCTETLPEPTEAAVPCRRTTPLMTLIPPLKVFAPVRVSVPLPTLTIASGPVLSARVPPNVVLVFKEPTVAVAGWLLVLLLRKMPDEPLNEPRLT